MADSPKKKPDLRSGLPGGEGMVAMRKGALAAEDPARLSGNDGTRVESDPAIVAPVPGKNVPEGQNTKG
jgi:hypothetical protein